jgi:hypothetical protein
MAGEGVEVREDEVLVVLIDVEGVPHLEEVLLEGEEGELRVCLPLPALHHLLSYLLCKFASAFITIHPITALSASLDSVKSTIETEYALSCDNLRHFLNGWWMDIIG